MWLDLRTMREMALAVGTGEIESRREKKARSTTECPWRWVVGMDSVDQTNRFIRLVRVYVLLLSQVSPNSFIPSRCH